MRPVHQICTGNVETERTGNEATLQNIKANLSDILPLATPCLLNQHHQLEMKYSNTSLWETFHIKNGIYLFGVIETISPSNLVLPLQFAMGVSYVFPWSLWTGSGRELTIHHLVVPLRSSFLHPVFKTMQFHFIISDY